MTIFGIGWTRRRNNPSLPSITEDSQRYSYRRFGGLVSTLAFRIAAEGVSHGDRVVLYLDKKHLHVAAYLANLTLGTITVHLYPEHPSSHVAFAASHTGAKLIVTTRSDLTIQGVKTLLLSDEIEDTQAIRPQLRPHPTAYLMFTSGTTSTPKAVITTQENLLFVTRTLIGLAGMKPGDHELIFMPLGSTGGSGHLHAAIVLGNAIELLPWFMADIKDRELEMMLDTIAQKRITGLLVTPRIVHGLLGRHRDALVKKGQGLRYMLANVTPMKQETIQSLLQLLPNLRFCTYYGLTEASRSVLNICRESPGYEQATGFPAPSVEVKIAPCADTPQLGEICIRGENVTSGYWNGEGAAVDQEDWFHSGDLGYFDETGRLFVTGRIKETISIDGLKCMPGEIESVINAQEGVDTCAVVPIPDSESYHRIGAAVTLKAPHPDERLKNRIATGLIDACRKHLSAYKVPAAIYILDQFPLTDLGKIKRLELAELLAGSDRGYPKS
ncbi:MAG: acyl--CoA ligase [Candidatus Thiodiazotropha sp. (ex Dulcina madagascariensis)]|nr:acyl--CoA ligase [Candidatus Thiodiazotropha sp. (ex Dulcina madagascariensis)]MCU7926605.1 acyl--CoA ligase [Candidatus Thiodiazotropha sp. (ex Dulcina madagascariensis)]